MILPLLLLQAAPAGPPPTVLPVPSEEAAPIVVTGDRPEQVVVGSRIPRRLGDDPGATGGQIATRTGVAGLVPGSGMDPFAGGTRRIIKRSCRADVEGLSKFALCGLARAQEALVKNDASGATAELTTLLADPALTAADRFFVHRLAWRMADDAGDRRGRTTALAGMVATELMRPEDEQLALKSLAAAALADGDRPAAIARLEALVALAPDEALAHGNLATLYSQAGRTKEARAQMADAVRLLTAAERPVPPGWAEYAAAH